MKKTLTSLLATCGMMAFVLIGTESCKKGGTHDGTTPPPPTQKKATVPLVSFPSTNLSNNTHVPYVVGHDSIVAGGNISSDGGATVTARGVCWSTSQNPTIANSKTTDGSGTGEYASYVNGLTVNTTYYLRAYATNSVGTGYSPQLSLTTVYIIGEHFGGGTIFYIDSTTVHGLIVAQYARSASAWGPVDVVGATSIFDGAGNTDKIIKKYGANAQNAAALCRACRDGGYTDWFLPALLQLQLLGAAPVGDIDWSSTEYDNGGAYVVSSPRQDNYAEAKGFKHPARPIRAF